MKYSMLIVVVTTSMNRPYLVVNMRVRWRKLQIYSEEICPKCNQMSFTQQNVKYFAESTLMKLRVHDELYDYCEGIWFLIKGPHMGRVKYYPDMTNLQRLRGAN